MISQNHLMAKRIEVGIMGDQVCSLFAYVMILTTNLWIYMKNIRNDDLIMMNGNKLMNWWVCE